jgi:hypothetical protein
LAGNVIDDNPKCRNKNQSQIKFTVEFYWDLITKFFGLDIKLPVNKE